jgi:hypothetical protein
LNSHGGLDLIAMNTAVDEQDRAFLPTVRENHRNTDGRTIHSVSQRNPPFNFGSRISSNWSD